MFTEKDHTFVLCAYKISEYLEDCIVSLLAQSVKSNIVISTSTPNEHISTLAEKYGLKIIVNNGQKGIGGDWNFGYDYVKTPLVTIAHQDDVYEETYTEEMLQYVNKAKNPILYFCSYKELRNGEKVYHNRLLQIKRLMLSPLKPQFAWNSKFIRRIVLSLGCPICCPSVTMVKKLFGETPFRNDYLSDVDWQQWEIQSRKKGAFVYNSKPLMCHRIHENSATTEIIGDNKRIKEDYEMFRKFWPKPIARLLCKLYKKSQKSNEV